MKILHHFEKRPQCEEEIKSLYKVFVNYKKLFERLQIEFNINNESFITKVNAVEKNKNFLYNELI